MWLSDHLLLALEGLTEQLHAPNLRLRPGDTTQLHAWVCQRDDPGIFSDRRRALRRLFLEDDQLTLVTADEPIEGTQLLGLARRHAHVL